MLFKRINPKTINCIISAQDLDAHGIRLDDLFQKREEAINSLKEIVVEAARRIYADADCGAAGSFSVPHTHGGE